MDSEDFLSRSPGSNTSPHTELEESSPYLIYVGSILIFS